MGVSPLGPDPPKEVLLARLRTLYTQLHDAQRHTRKYERLSAEIHELSMAYDKLVDATLGIRQPPHKK